MANNYAPGRSTGNTSAPSTEAEDRLVDFREVHRAVGSKCKTGHAARELAARGLIRAVRLNERTLRYSWNSVQALVQGKAGA